MKIQKTNVGELEAVCDKCNRLARREEVIEVYSITSDRILHYHRDPRRCLK